MSTLDSAELASLLKPFLGDQVGLTCGTLLPQISIYLDLLVKWNARMNLTAIRDPREMVVRHFGESLFAASLIPEGVSTVLDLGSGAGFPGLPIQLMQPHLQVTLAESQGKKAAFLREVIRTLGLQTRVHAGRAEDLCGVRSVDLVTMRSVDDSALALRVARDLLAPSGRILHLTTGNESGVRVPSSRDRVVVLY